MVNETLPLRARQRMATEQAIRDVVLRLCAERGIGATTVDRIAEEAGISKRTFFRYFDSKEEATVPSMSVVTDVLEHNLSGVDSVGTAYRALSATMRALHKSVDDAELYRMKQSFALRSTDDGIGKALGAQQAKLSAELLRVLGARVPQENAFELRLMVSALTALDHAAWIHWCETDPEMSSPDRLLELQSEAHAVLEGRFG